MGESFILRKTRNQGENDIKVHTDKDCAFWCVKPVSKYVSICVYIQS